MVRNTLCLFTLSTKACLFIILAVFGPDVMAQLGEDACGTSAVVGSSGPEARGMNCANTGTDWIATYRKPEHWVPANSTPVKTILVNFVICRNSLGENGWPDTPGMRADFDNLIAEVNEVYNTPLSMGYEVTCPVSISPISDTRIQFKLNEVYYFDWDLWNSYAYTSECENILDSLWAMFPESKQALNHIFTQPNSWPGGYWGEYRPYSDESYVFTRNSMWGNTSVWQDHVDHVAHEYGHAVGLGHTYDGSEAGVFRTVNHYDFLDDVFGTCAEPALTNPAAPCYSGCSPPSSDYVCHLKNCFYNLFD